MADEQDFEKLPLPDKLAHKNWKARSLGYQQLRTLFIEFSDESNAKDSPFIKFQDSIKPLASESNVVALESGLEALYAYVENAPEAAKRSQMLVPLVAEKLGSNRPKTKALAIDILAMFVEIEKQDVVIEGLIPFIGHKQPKLVVGTIEAIRSLLSNFGAKVIPIKDVLKSLHKIFGHSDKKVRSEGNELALEIYKWIKNAIQPSLKELKPMQLKELEELFEKHANEKANPSRYLRSQMALPPTKELQVSEEIQEEIFHEVEEVDPLQFVEAIDIYSKLNKNFYSEIASSKWKERKEALEGLLEILKHPKFQDGKHHELIGALVKLVRDANMIVATLAINSLERLAIGSRESFSIFRSSTVPILIEKLKEKKQSIVEALQKCLDAIFQSSNLADNLEDISEGLKKKNPNIKLEVLKWLGRCIASVPKPPEKAVIKTIGDICLQGISDGSSDVRDAGAEALGILMKVIGEKHMIPLFEKIGDKNREAKVREYCENAQVKCKSGQAKGRTTGASKNQSGFQKKEAQKISAGIPKTSFVDKNIDIQNKENNPPSGLDRKKMSSINSTQRSLKAQVGKPVKKETLSPVGLSSVEEKIILKYSYESALLIFSEKIDNEVIENLGNSNWKLRFGACNQLFDDLQSDISKIDPEVVLHVLSRTPGMKDANFQVSCKVFGIIDLLIQKSPAFSKGAGSLAISGLAEKLGDPKVKVVAGNTLLSMAEKFSVQFVLSGVYQTFRDQKSPKVLSDSVMWIHTLVSEFGINGIDVKELTEFLKFTIASSNATVRSSTIVVLSDLYMFVGPEYRRLLQDWPSNVLGTIDSAFEKIVDRQPPAPQRDQGDKMIKNDSGDLFPRVDIVAALGDAIMEQLNDSNWKTRKEALQLIMEALESANYRITPNLGELHLGLKARLNDSNRNLVAFTLDIVAAVAKSMGSDFDKYSKTLCGPVVSCFNDNKPQVRLAAVNAFTQILENSSFSVVANACGSALMHDSPILRKDLLKWLCDILPRYEGQDFSPLIIGLLTCLQDRSSDVRKQAQTSVKLLMDLGAADLILEKATDIRGLDLQQFLGNPDNRASVSSISSSGSQAQSKSPTSRRPPSIPSKQNLTNFSGVKDNTSTAANIPRQKQTKKLNESIENENIFPILTNDIKQKEMRADRDRGLTKWIFEPPRRELIEILRDQFESNFATLLYSNLFNEDHSKEKYHLLGLSMLDECLVDIDVAAIKFTISPDEILLRFYANLDLILKYITIRFFDSNMSIFLKCLDILEHLFSLLDQKGLYLSEYEASCFLPFFVNKVGDNKESLRLRVRSIMKQICHIYPASKFFNYLVDFGLKSKNSRTKAECLEELGVLIQKNGSRVCLLPKVLPIIATHISGRDSNIRNGAISALTQVYLLIGEEQLFKYIGNKIAEKDKDLLQEKLKRIRPSSMSINTEVVTSYASDAPTVSAESGFSDGSLPRSMDSANLDSLPSSASAYEKRDFSLDIDQLDLPKISNSAKLGFPQLASTELPSSLLVAPTPVIPFRKRGTIESNAEYDYQMELLINQVSASPAQSIEALIRLEGMLSKTPEALKPYVNQLITSITQQFRVALNDSQSPLTTRLCKHLINALAQTFNSKILPPLLSRQTVQHLWSEMFNKLITQTSFEGDFGPQLTRAINVLMVKVLESCKQNVSYGALFGILRDDCISMSNSSGISSDRHARMADLAMKSIWRLSKSLKKNLEMGKIHPNELLLDMYEFLQMCSPPFWKERALSSMPLSDYPLRTVKTILHELCSILGEDIMNHLTLIPDVDGSYINSYLQHLLAQRRDTSTSNDTNTTNNDIQTETMSKELSNEDRDDLKGIFQSISQRELTKQALRKLHVFRKDHPEAESLIQEYIEKTGKYFQTYIRRSLEKLENEEAESEASPEVIEDSPPVSSSTISTKEDYRQRLAKFQQMFGSTGKETHNKNDERISERSEESKNKAENVRTTDIEYKTFDNKGTSSIQELRRKLDVMRNR